MILGGLAAALGMVTHPIYSIVRETLGYIIAFRWGINLQKMLLNNKWLENYILLQVFKLFLKNVDGQKGKLNSS